MSAIVTRERDERAAIKRTVSEQLDALDLQDLREVLAFSQALAAKRRSKEKGGALLAFAGAISQSDLAEMSRAIDESCERIDDEAW
jgi:hypothetical protein